MSVPPAIAAPRFALEASPNFCKPGVAMSVNLESRVSGDVAAQLGAVEAG